MLTPQKAQEIVDKVNAGSQGWPIEEVAEARGFLSGLEAGREGMRADAEYWKAECEKRSAPGYWDAKLEEYLTRWQTVTKVNEELRTQLKEQAEQLEALEKHLRKIQDVCNSYGRVPMPQSTYLCGNIATEALDSINRGKAS